MAGENYPFIDIAVLDGVRERFLAGDAAVVLDTALERIIWANGAGAALFGQPDVESARGATVDLGVAGRRQIAATPGYPKIGPGRALLVRLQQGLTSSAIGFVASHVDLPGGETGILLAAPDAKASQRSAEETGGRIIFGIAQEGEHAALIDGKGLIIAQSAHFADAGLATETLQQLASDVSAEADRLAKRIIRSGGRSLPTGIALLSSDPLRALVIVIEDGETDQVTASVADEPKPGNAAAANEKAAAKFEDNWEFSDRRPVRQTVLPEPATEKPEPAPIDAAIEPDDMPEPAATGETDVVQDNDGPADPLAGDDNEEQADAVLNGPAEASGEAPEQTSKADAEPTAEAAGHSQIDATDDNAGLPTPRLDPDAAPVRFVWKTDADGRFSSLSPEFAAVVGSPAADVVGQRFRDVAKRFALDPDEDIAGLLDRRDTWSGRSVMWPVSGTDLKVPVDLAALPVYGRERNFEGFRGFGVVRAADAIVDDDAIGLTFAGGDATDPGAETGDVPAVTGYGVGEPPVLAVSQTPGRRETDKVVQLSEHRPVATPRSLSTAESSAFREIAERLRDAGKDDEAGNGVEPDKPEATGETVDARTNSFDDGGSAGKDKDHDGLDLEDNQGAAEIASRVVADPDDDDDLPDDIAGSADDDNRPADPEDYIDGPDEGSAASSQEASDDALLLEKLPVPVLVHCGDRLHFANEEFFSLTGYASLADFEDAGGLDCLFVDNDGQAPDDHRRWLKTKDGREFPVEALLQSVPWNGGKALLLALKPEAAAAPEIRPDAAVADVEEHDLDLRLAEMRTILDTATDGIVIINNEGAIRSVSRPAEALFGFDAFELVGKPFVSLFALESQKAARDYLGGLSENGVASVLNDGREVIGREAKGRFIPLFMTIGKLPGGNGFCAVLRDITQWKRAEEELTQARAEAERSSSQKTEFLARISHEIRTPLNAIIGFSELMIDEKFGPIVNDRYKDYLRDINRSGNHVLDLVNDLLDISKIEAGEQEMAHEAVSLNESLAEAVAMMQPQANRERVIIRSSFASRLPEVVADQRAIRQIALNLLSNAVRYTQAGGQVIVSTSYESTGDVMMRVRDTGIGMSQSEIEQALRPFKQINALKRPRGDGTGLGLPLTKAMVEANRARFSIQSAPGDGTLVEITFPSTRVLAS